MSLDQKRNYPKAYACLLALSLLTACSNRIHENDPANTIQASVIDSFRKHSLEIRIHRISTTPSSNANATSRLRAHESFLPEDSWESIYELWLLEDDDALLRTWWETDNPETRMLIVALCWCLHPPPDQGSITWPEFIYDFEAKTDVLAEHHAKMRKAECSWVRKNIQELRALILKAIGENNLPRAMRLRIISAGAR